MRRKSQLKEIEKTEGALSSKERLNYAKLGLIALIDEATGYQEVRAKNALKIEKAKLDFNA